MSTSRREKIAELLDSIASDGYVAAYVRDRCTAAAAELRRSEMVWRAAWELVDAYDSPEALAPLVAALRTALRGEKP